jgi:hypothetical protein
MKTRLFAAIAALACATSAQALVTTVTGFGATAYSTEHSGADFHGSLSFDDAANLLTVELTNTSPLAVGGFLTAFAFNAPEAATVSFASSTLAGFNHFLEGPNTAPFLGFEYGMGVGNNYNGGGKPADGLAVNATASWTFNVSGGSFTALDFITPGSVYGETYFVTRFRGLANGGSDKLPGTDVLTAAIPEPSSYALMLAGLAMLAFMARRRTLDR